MKKILLFILICISLWSCSSQEDDEEYSYFSQFTTDDWYTQQFGQVNQVVDIEGIKCKQLLFSEDVNIFWREIPYCIQTDSILYWFK